MYILTLQNWVNHGFGFIGNFPQMGALKQNLLNIFNIKFSSPVFWHLLAQNKS